VYIRVISAKTLKTITQILLLSVIAIVPFLKISSLYFPYVSGKVYVFRLLVMLAFFFWVWGVVKVRLNSVQISSSSANLPNFYYPLWLPFKNILVAALLLFFLAQVFVSFFGVNPLLSFFSSIERADGVLQYGFWVLYFLLLISVFRKEQDWKMFFSVFVIAAVFLSAYSWLNYGSQAQLYGVFGNPAYFAAYLLFAIGFSLLLAVEKKNNLSTHQKTTDLPVDEWRSSVRDSAPRASVGGRPQARYHVLARGAPFLAAAGFFALTLIFTQIRGAYAGLAGGVFLFSLLSVLFLRGEEDKKLAIFCGIVLLLGVASTTLLFAAKETDFVKSRPLLSRVTEVTDVWGSASVRERFLNWNIALKAFKEKPVFGWGPENFGSAANKYYDYRIGRGEPWFDRAHNNPIEILATGGIVLFSFYLFWLAAVFYIIFKIARPGSRISTERSSNLSRREVEISLPGKEKKILSFILASVFLAYFLQGFFLFDLLAVYLGLFPFLAFLVFEYNSIYRIKREEPFGAAQGKQKKENNFGKKPSLYVLIPSAFFSLFVIYTACFIPYKANASALQFYALTENGFYKESKPFLEQAFDIKSPYTFWEVRKRAGWQFLSILEYRVNKEMEPEKIKEIEALYDFLTPELEKFIVNKPYEPQMYYVLARMYRFGFEKLGKDDLEKAEIVIRKGFNYSDLRVEYFNEFGQILLLQGKFEEAEKSVKDYVQRVNFYEYFPYVTLGHFYFVAGKYDLAMEQYDKARETGYKFYENSTEYSRYMTTAENLGEYQKIVNMAQEYLGRWGPDGDTYFNIAVGYFHLEEKEKTREFFLKAVELKKEYEEYRSLFAP